MSRTSARHDGTVFDALAAQYDRSRPTYPAALIAHACQLAGIASGDRVLEVGCGSGQLTRDLGARGLLVTAVEPGRQLIALARQHLQDAGDVEFFEARFEDAQLPDSHFRAAFSASAFHWIDPDISWQKVARTLVPGGTLALLQYCGLNDQRSAADQEALLSALARIAPQIAASWPAYRDLAATIAGVQQRRSNVSAAWAWVGSHQVARSEAGRLFCDVQIAAVPTLLEQTAAEVNALLRTHSFYARLSARQRQALTTEIIAIAKQLGRPIRSSIVAVLVTARRTTEP